MRSPCTCSSSAPTCAKCRGCGKFLDALGDRLDPSLRDRLYRCRWVVDCRPPFGSAEHVRRYLELYTHRVGISDHRLLRLSDDTVTFRTRHPQTETCSVVEFLRRFLGHVLPRSFVRLRYYGLLASRNLPTRLAKAQRCLPAGKTFTPRRLRLALSIGAPGTDGSRASISAAVRAAAITTSSADRFPAPARPQPRR